MRKILVDLSSAQGASTNSGIGKYSYSLCRNLIKKIILNNWKPIVLLNDLYSGDALLIKESFTHMSPETTFIKMHLYDHAFYAHPDNLWSYYANIEIRNFINYIVAPDYQFIPSFLGRGWIESNTVYNENSFSKFATGVVVYDDYVNKYKAELNIPIRLSDLYVSQIRMLRSCTNIFSISDYTKNAFIHYPYFLNNEIITIYGGSDLEDVKKDLPKKLDYIPSNSFFLVVFSSFDYRKNLEVLIKSLSEIEIDYLSDTTIVITGNIENSKLEYYKNIIKSFNLNNNLFKFVGFISNDDLINLYKSTDLLIITSRDESLCLPLLAAFEFETPVIAPNNSVFPELLKDDIFLYEDDNSISLSNKIKLFLCDSEFKSNIRSKSMKLKSKYKWDNSSDKIINNIKKLFITHHKQLSPINNVDYHDLYTKICLNSQMTPSNLNFSNLSILLNKNLQSVRESLKI